MRLLFERPVGDNLSMANRVKLNNRLVNMLIDAHLDLRLDAKVNGEWEDRDLGQLRPQDTLTDAARPRRDPAPADYIHDPICFPNDP